MGSVFLNARLMFLLLPLWLLLVGCGAKPVEELGTARGATIPAEVPTYAEIAARHNARVAEVEQYWSAIRARLRWYDYEQGEWREESGEGHLIFERPRNVALTFSKVGEIGFWAGSNAEEYWVFEGGDEPQVFVGRNENAFQPCAEPLPISVHPLELMDLAGLFVFPVISEADSARVRQPTVGYSSVEGAWKIDLPGRWSIRRVYLDVRTLLPSRVELRSRFDREVVYAVAELPVYVRQRVSGLSESAQPLVPSKFILRQAGVAGEVTLNAYRPADRTGNGPIRPQVFEYQAVARVMKPGRTHILDANCAEPAEVD